MKVLHVLNSRIYSGAEKVASQIIRDFEDEMTLAYCSPESEMVEKMLAEQNIRYIPVKSLLPWNLRKVIREEQPDLIHAHDMRATLIAALCCGKRPLISHIHNNAYDARGLTLKSIGYLYGGFKAKKIIWVSSSSFEGYFFHKLFAKKSTVLYNIIDEKQIFDKKAGDPATYDYDMIYLGRLTYQKDPQRLIRLCARLRDRKPDIKVAIVGTGELDDEVKALRDQLGLQENVELLGFCANPMKMVADSKTMILTSRWEGTPMCALEAMALGTPIVSTPSDGMKDLLENGVSGYLTDDDTIMTDAVLKIVTDPAHRQMLSHNARETFRKINDVHKYKQAIAECYYPEAEK